MPEIPLCRFKVSIYNTAEDYQRIFDSTMKVFFDIASDVPFFRSKKHHDIVNSLLESWYDNMLQLYFHEKDLHPTLSSEYYEEHNASFNIKGNIINTIITISR
jgi:hypothetical protein